MKYHKLINELVEEMNSKRGDKHSDRFSIYQESGMYTILSFGRRISPVMTAKECYKTLQTLDEVAL